MKPANIARLTRFVDATRVRFRGGNGGDGCIAMLSLFANEYAGPSGGNGGNGGHVVLRADSQVKSLSNVASIYRAEPGERGRSKSQNGRSAEHLVVPVPIGTLVLPAKPADLDEHEFNPEESSILAELDEDGSMFIAARGGAGGRGNESFLSNANRHPFIAERGAQGEANHYELRMRFYAHVALVGMPNAGKSTLLTTLTGAQVEIGDYAFTTLHPQVGTVEYEDFTQLTISDLPGLVEEAHKNRGLGLSFMRSLGRCCSLLYVIDLTKDPVHQFELLREESRREPSAVFCNKADLIPADNAHEFERYLAGRRPEMPIIFGSARNGTGLSELRMELRKLL